MRRHYSLAAAALLLAASLPMFATVFATLHGVVHNAQHRPIAGEENSLQAADSEFQLHAKSNADGTLELQQAPIGVYRLNVTNHRVLLDNSITIGGFPWKDPRMISAELRYRFHF
jgi:hypothetical protein